MQKSFKKAIATFLVVLMLMTSVPLNGFVGMDWSFLTASAAEENITENPSEEKEDNFISSENRQFENKTKLLEFTQQIKNNIGELTPTMMECFSAKKSVAPMTTFSLRNAVSTVEDETDFMWEYDEETQTLTISGSGTMPDYEPLESEEIAVNTPWFSYANDIKKVVVEEGITSIGMFAFALCTNLTEVILPEGITSIGGAAFAYDINLKSIALPSTLKSIGNMAFGLCWSVEELVLPDEIETIEDSAFMYMFNLEAINIPKNIQYIGEGAFVYLLHLKEVIIPDGVVAFNYNLTEDLYSYSIALESIVNNSSVAVLDQFFDVSFTNIEFAEAYSYMMANYLKYEMFFGSAIPGIVITETALIEDTINYLNDKFGTSYMISDYNTFEDFVESVAEKFFATHMLEIPYPPYYTITCINDSAQHEYCKENTIKHKISGESNFCTTCLPMDGTIGDNITWTIDAETKTLTFNGTGEIQDDEPFFFLYDEWIDHIVILEGITNVPCELFWCMQIETLNIPATVETVYAEEMAQTFSKITEINVSEDNGSFYSVEGVLFGVEDNEKYLLLYPNSKVLEEYTVPEDVSYVTDAAFYRANVGTVIIDENIKALGSEDVFCYSLIDKIIFNSATCEVGEYTFYGYYGLIYCYADSVIYEFAYENELGEQVVVIEDKEVISIEVNPIKTEYMQGDPYCLKDISLNVIYADGTTSVRKTGFSVSGYDSSELGAKTVSVSYGDLTVDYVVTIVEKTFKEISLNQTATLTCNNNGETEFIKFIPTVSGTYIFKSVSDVLNLYSINVYDGQFNSLSNYYYNNSSSFEFYYTYEANTTYYITVKFSVWNTSTSVDATMLCAHDGDWAEITPPSCTASGVEACMCVCCGEYVTREIATISHSYEETARTNASCSKNGSITYTCSVCNASYDQIILATHTDVNNDNICDVCGGTAITVLEKDNPVLITLGADGIVSLQFTPSYSGYFRLYSYLEDGTYSDTYCTIYCPDGNSYSNDNGNGNGHFGLSYYLNQGETYSYQVKYASTADEGSFYVKLECEHSGNWTETKKPTCTEAGEMSCVCYYCNETITKKISATGHNDTDNDRYCNICLQDICLGSITVGEELSVIVKSAYTNEYIRFEPEETEYLNISISSNISGYAYIYDANGNELDYDSYSENYPGEYGFAVEKGKTYFIRLHNYSDNGTVNINVTPLTEKNLVVGSAINVLASDKTTYFKFVPSITAKYMFNFKVQQDYVYLYIYDCGLNQLTWFHTGTYDSEDYESFEFEAGKTYYIGVGTSNTDSILEFMCPHTDVDTDNKCDICGITMTDIIATGMHGDNINWSLKANGELTLEGSGEMVDGTVAGEFTDLVKKVVIDNEITSIGSSAFSEATLLEEITIPSSIAKIGSTAFAFTTSLEEIIIPSSVIQIGSGAFAGGIKKVTVSGGENFTVVDGILYDYNMTTVMFYPMSKNEAEYIMPETVVSADMYAFYGCSNIKSITFSESFESINYTIFYWSSLDSVTILNKNATINYIPTNTVINGYIGSTAETYAQTNGNTFIALDSKKAVGISVYQMPYKTSYYSFEEFDSEGLAIEVTYDDGTTTIKDGGFEVSDLDTSSMGTKSLTVTYENLTVKFDVVVKDVTEIRLNDKISLDINGSDKEYVKFIPVVDGSYKFCTTDAEYYNYIYIYDSDMNLLTYNSGSSAALSYSFVAGEIYYIAVRYSYSEYSGSLNLSVECAEHFDVTDDDVCDCCGIDLNAVIATGDCGESATWTINLKKELIISGNGAINDYDYSEEAPWKAYSTQIERIIVNSGITTIGEYAFYDLEKVDTVSLPETLTDIKYYSFASCEALESIVLPASAVNLGGSVFSNCSNLSDVTLSGSLTTIPSYMFSDCSALAEINIPESVTTINSGAFSNCESLTQITLPENVEEVSYSAFDYCSKLSKLLVDEDNSVFASDDGVLTSKDGKSLLIYPLGKEGTEYSVPETVEVIGEYAFKDSVLESIIVPGTVKKIENNAFSSSELKKVEISDGVTEIGSYAFSWCRKLTSVKLPETLTDVSANLFWQCDSLSEVKIPENVSKIYSYAFDDCSNLKSIIVPGKVQSIGSYAFDGCTSLESITFINPETEIYDYDYTINKSTVIYGRKASTAEAYAEKYLRSFVEAGKAESITVLKEPAKKSFYNIEEFDPTGLEIKISYDDATEAIVKGYELSEIDYSIIGEQDVIVSYGDLETSFAITLNEPISISNGQIINCEVKENDKFYYRYVPSVSGTYNVYFTEKVADDVKVGTALYDADMKSIGSKWFGGNDDYITYSFEANEEYFICVYSYSEESVGNIAIEIRCKTHIDNNEDEFCDICGYDSALGREELIPGKAVNVACSNNTVYFKFIPTTSQKYKIYSSNVKIDENTVTQYNTSVTLCDKNKSYLTYDNDSGEDYNFLLEYDFVAGETYYFGISCSGDYETNAVFPVILECVKHVDDDNNYYCDICNRDYSDIMASGTCGENITWTLNYKGDLSISGSGSMYSGDVYSPWDDYRDTVNTVSISDGITTLGNNAFYNCRKIKSVVLPESIATIGKSAFENCTSLTSVNIPDAVTEIPTHAFYNCALNEVALPVNLSYVGDYAFYECNFRNIDIPVTVTEIGEYAFAYCDSLENLVLPTGLSKISVGLAYYCSSLNSVVIGENVGSIGYRAFSNCSSAENINIPDSVLTIGKEAFKNCNTLTEVNLPDVITSIGEEAFSGCSKITEISIPENITIIEKNTFANCSSLNNVTLNEKVETIGDNAFSSCTALSQIRFPDSLKDIGKAAFKSCALVTIDIPATTSEISTDGLNNAFIYCNQLEEINVSSENISYCSVDGVWYNKDKTKIIMYPTKKTDTEYTVKETVSEVNTYAFYSQDYLEKVVLPDGITHIGEYTFSECENLQSIRLPETLESIGNYAFYKCSNLSDIAIPNSVETIGNNAFYNCSSISDIALSENIKKISSGAFANCFGMQTVSILNPDAEIYNSSSTLPSSARILGYEGSTANNYAEEYSRDFNSLVSITNIEILSDLSKKEYTPFDSIDTTGLTLTVYYDDGTSNTVNSGFTVSGFDRNAIGMQTLTIDYVGHTVTTEVELLDCCRLNISVVDTLGNIVPEALVTVVDQAGNKVKKTADEDGFVQIDALSGDCYIGAMKGNDYIPIQNQYIHVDFGKSGNVELALVPQQAVEIKSEIRELNLEEIIALGIDTDVPENRLCYEINVDLKYQDTPLKLKYRINGRGKMPDKPEVYPSSSGSGGSGGSSSGSWSADVINTSAGPAYAIIHIPNTVSYLKEFYNVKLSIQFNAAEDMVLRNNKLKLNIPEGLTLMSKLNGNYIETENFEFDTLYGQEKKEYEFILRGDIKGSYHFNVNYSGILDFFDEKIETTYTNPEPIEVCGFDDVKINLNFCDEIHDGYLHYNISLLNERDKNIYCPNINVGEITEELINVQSSGNEEIVTEVLKMYVTDESGNVTDYTVEYDGFGKPIAPIDTLKPNEKITYEYVSYYVFEEVDIGYLVSASADVLKGMAENVIVGTFHWKPELGGAKKGSIELGEDIIFLNTGEEYQFNPTIKDETPQQKVEWSISKPEVADITQTGLVKGLSDGFAMVTVTLTNSKTHEFDWDSCYVFVGEPNSLVLDSVYDSIYYYAEGGFYSKFSSVSDCVEIYYTLSNALDESIDDLTIYDEYNDELSANCKPVKPVTVTAKVDGQHLSFDSESYVNTYSMTFDTIEFAHAVDDILMLFPYNLDGNISDAGETYTVEVTYESESFVPFTETYEFKVEPLATKSAKEHIEAIRNVYYPTSKYNYYGEAAMDLKNDVEYVWSKYSNLDIFTNYYEIVVADMLVLLLDAAQTENLSLPSLVPDYIKEWVDSYKTVKKSVKTIADDDYEKLFDISEDEIDKLLKKSKYLGFDDETKTDLGMQVDDKVRDWCLTAFKGKDGSINIEKVNKVFAGIDKTKQGLSSADSLISFAFDTTNSIVDYCNKITLFNTYAGMENSFHDVMESFANRIPDGKMKEAVYDYINYTGDFSEQLSTVFEETGELFLEVGLDAFKTFMGKSFVNYSGAKIFNWIGNIAVDGGTLAQTAGFAGVSTAFSAFFMGLELGICVSNLVCGTGALAEEMAKMISIAEYTPYIIQTLDFYESNMRNSLTDESVDLFEYAFLLHKISQSKTIDFMIKSTEIKKDSILNRWFGAFKKDNLPALISGMMDDKAAIDSMNCCGYKDELSTVQRKHRVISIKCPVDIIIYDSEGNKIFEIVNNEIVLNKAKLTAIVVDSEKYISLPADMDYSIEIIATDEGTMDYSVVEYSDGVRVRVVDTEDIELKKDKFFNGSIPMTYEISPEEYELESEDVVYSATRIIDKPIESLAISENSLEICINSTYILSATITPLDATVTAVNWTSSNTDVATVDENGKIVAVSEGEAVITVSTEEWGFFETCTVSVCDHKLKEHKAVTSTCVENGSNLYYECSICDKLFKDSEAQNETTIEAETLPLGDHSFGEWEIVIASTCVETGLEKRICLLCPHYEEQEVKTTGHDYRQIITAPTCTEDGYTTNTCSVCQDSYISDVTEKLGHTGGTANCKDKAVCSRCENAYGEININNHKNVVADKAVSATCTSTGLTDGSHCDACGKVIITQTTIEKLSHTEEILPAVAATCTKTGLTEGKKCSTCGETLVKQDEIAKLAHSYKSVVTAPTCTADGYTTNTCSACKDSYISDVTEKLGHTGGTANCEDKAICTVCGEAYGEINPDNHKNVVTDKAVSATCTSTGLTEGIHCDTCGKVIVAQTTTEKLPHTEEILPAVAATCSKSGLTEGKKCSICGEILVKQTETAKLEHSYKSVVTAPTCTNGGYTTYTCYVCKHDYKANETAKLGHSMGNFIVVEQPSCTENGLEIAECSRCDYSEIKEISATGHNYQDGICTECGDSKSDNCSCNCHKTGFMGLIWKILRFFYKLFGINKVCGCGVTHY
ncbi:MAG: leucine-rich repeat protein [Clostridia bacterium]|nr:leucine-rich repeat protein [Clostridia bacterium]